MDKQQLKTIAENVRLLLETDEKTRKDDWRLLLRMALINNPRIKNMSIQYVMEHSEILSMPNPDTITRARRREQRSCPELKIAETAISRAKDETVHRKFFSRFHTFET